MLHLKLDEAKELLFDLSVEGIDKKLLSGKFRLTIDSVEYGFPCEILNDKIKVSIPALSSVLKEGMSGTYKATLDIVGNNTFLVPWNDVVEIKVDPKVIAKPEPVLEQVTKDLKIKAYLTSESKVEEELKPVKKQITKNSSLRNKLF